MPKGIAVHEGYVYLADAGAHCIWVFSTSGCFQKIIGRHGSEPGRFRTPTGVATANGRLYVTEYGGERLQARRCMHIRRHHEFACIWQSQSM